ncbi:MAG: EscU/YscU/HrcU family type III secretion system export apparatus switch protein, partial [Rhodothermales bacterium]|nr:EscU/YscU/HrcU family type III secretion system export apparatus switch protein [Rhodothermales bacterium]
MSDAPEKHEKTFDPTPRRLEKAREEGNVFRSREMVSVGMLSVGIGAVALGLRPAFGVLEGTAEAVFRSATTTTLTVASVQELFAGLGMQLSMIALPFAAVLLA